MESRQFISRRPADYWVLWSVTIGLVLLNAALIVVLLSVRAQVALATDEAAQVVGELKSSSISTTIDVDDEVAIDGSVPIETTIEVPIEASIPVNTTVSIPIEFPIVGVRTVRIPIQTTIPVDLRVDVPIDYDVPIQITVPVKLKVPVYVGFGDTEFGQALGEVEAFLKDLSVRLGGASE